MISKKEDMTKLSYQLQTISYNGNILLMDMDTNVTALSDPYGVGLFLHVGAIDSAARQVFQLGNLNGVRRLLCHYRAKPFWMTPAVVTRAGDIPVETQFLLAELSSGQYALLVPLLDGAFRMSLQGTGENGLEVIAESGDPAVTTSSVVGLFIAVGEEPFALIEQAAQSVCARMKTGHLRRDKELPAFIDQFGWCTWDAFYETVSHEKVNHGLESFSAGGIHPRLLILDAGWQSIDRAPIKGISEGQRLVSFDANEKFPGGLAITVEMAKHIFGVQTFLVWHAIMGATGGVDGERLPGYGVRYIPWQYSPGVLQSNPDMNEVLGNAAGVIPPDSIRSFFNDYHRELSMEGVDGVKADFQTTLEGLGASLGGRVELMRRYHEALESSVHAHFQGNLINCMSCSNDMLYTALNSNLARTSDDFFPANPASHGMHLYTNAQVGLWFGEFIHPDWDMFQSAHELGAFHAAGRAISGGPLYVSDKPDAHDFALLRKLVLPNGHILRAKLPGRPTRDCLFSDPTREDAPLKVFNRNAVTGVIGVFNCRAGAQAPTISASLRPADVVGLSGELFAVYAHTLAEVRVLAREAVWTIDLAPMNFEIFTITAIEHGVAPLGLIEMFNSGGAIIEAGFNPRGEYEMLVHAGGKIAIWCAQPPKQVWLDEQPTAYEYQTATSLLYTQADQASPTIHVRIILADSESGA
jgi:raffinose synthase